MKRIAIPLSILAAALLACSFSGTATPGGTDLPTGTDVPVGSAVPVNTELPTSTEEAPTPDFTRVPGEAPMFTFDRKAICREGPNTRYELVGLGLVGEQVRIEGLSDPAGWYYVLLTDAVTRCFVDGSTGNISGDVDGLSVIVAVPLPVAPPAPVLNVSNRICDATTYVVRLSWEDVDGEDYYDVYRDGILLATLVADITFYDDTSPDHGGHSYHVQAFNYVPAFNFAGASNSNVAVSEGCVY